MTTPGGGVIRMPPESCCQLDRSLTNCFASPSSDSDSIKLATPAGVRLPKNQSVFSGAGGRFVKYPSGRLSAKGVAVSSPHGFAKGVRPEPEAAAAEFVGGRPNHRCSGGRNHWVSSSIKSIPEQTSTRWEMITGERRVSELRARFTAFVRCLKTTINVKPT